MPLARTLFLDQLHPLSYSVDIWAPLAEAFSLNSALSFWPLLVLCLSSIIFLYSLFYFQTDDLKRFLVPFFVFTPAMYTLVATDHLLLLFIAWELTSLSSYFMIAFEPHQEKARKGALSALLITGLGGLFLLGAVLGLYSITGSFSIQEALYSKNLITGHPFVTPIICCLLLAILTKSAQFPFHFWLPGAMSAPIPASALLHSATMVKAGVFLAALFHPLFFENEIWKYTLLSAGLITFFWGGFCAFRTADLKSALAQTTLAALGLMIASIGSLHPSQLTILTLIVLSHALYKSSGFLWVGALEKTFKSREYKVLSSVRAAPLLHWTGLAFGASLIGLPPLLGFVGKEALLTEITAQPLLVVLFGLGLAASSTLGFAILRTLLSASKDLVKIAYTPSSFIVWIPLILASIHLLLGLGIQFISPIVGWGELSLWHGFNAPLFASLALFILGFVLSIHLKPFPRGDLAITGSLMFQNTQDSILSFGKWTACLMSVTHFQINLGVLSLVFAGSGWMIFRGQLLPPAELAPIDSTGVAIAVFILLFAWVACWTQAKVVSLLALGGAGFMVALFFAYMGAPDLSLTQLCVEGLSVVLLLLLIQKSLFVKSEPTQKELLARHLISFVLASFVGSMAWLHLNFSRPSLLKDYFLNESLPGGKGSNVVNVILVDFRALDTLGEISVLVLAGIGVAAVWQQLKRSKV